MKWFERLAQIIENRSLRIEDVASRAGVPVKSLYGYLKGDVENPRGEVLKRLADAVDVTEVQLRHGELPSNALDVRWLQIIDMNKLRTLKSNELPGTKWDGRSKMPVPNDVSMSSFAVRLVDNSGTPTHRKGDVIICDPTADIEPGDFVLVVLTDEQQVHFGQYRPLSHRKSSRFELSHANSNYPTIEVGGRVKGFILGRAVKHIRDM